MKKKVLTMLVLMWCLFGLSITGKAAQSISTDMNYGGSLAEKNTKNSYTFTLRQSGKIKLTVSAQLSCSNYNIYDSNGKEIWKSGANHWNSSTGMMNFSKTLHLTAGSYVLEICNPGCWYQHDGGVGSYNFEIDYTAAEQSFPENGNGQNNTYATAQPISVDTEYCDQLAINDREDYYRFQISKSGEINLIVSAQLSCSNYNIYDSKGKDIWKSGANHWNSSTEIMNLSNTMYLTAGSYVLEICNPGCEYQHNGGYGNYSFKLNYTAIDESFPETGDGVNNTYAEAQPINVDTTYRGHLAFNDRNDFYRFQISRSGEVSLSVSAQLSCSNYSIYDGKGKDVWKSGAKHWNSSTTTMNFNETVYLEAGSYVLEVCNPGCQYVHNGGYGGYTFTIKTTKEEPTKEKEPDKTNEQVTSIQLNKKTVSMYLGTSAKKAKTIKLKATVFPSTASNKGVTWKTADRSVAVVSKKGVITAKGVGTTVISCKAQDGSGKIASCVVKVSPGKAAFSKVKKTSKKSTFYIKKQSGVTGYQVYVRANGGKKFVKYKTLSRKTLKFSCSKKYDLKHQFKVRAYKKVGKKMYYGEFSKVY